MVETWEHGLGARMYVCCILDISNLNCAPLATTYTVLVSDKVYITNSV